MAARRQLDFRFPKSPDPASGLFVFLLTPISSQRRLCPNLSSQRGRARFGGVLCIAHHFVAARLLPTKKFSSSTATKLRARRALPSCELAESRCMKLKRSPEHDFCG